MNELLKHEAAGLSYKDTASTKRIAAIPANVHTNNQAASESLVGLTTQEAQERLSKYGPNDPAPVRRGALIQELLLLFVNPLVVILLIAAIASGILGQRVDAGIIIFMVLLGIAINFAQTYRSQKAIERLREHVSLSATVLRDGKWQE